MLSNTNENLNIPKKDSECKRSIYDFTCSNDKSLALVSDSNTSNTPTIRSDSYPNFSDRERYFMESAIQEAMKAYDIDEVPIGCVLIKDDKIIARAHNLKESSQDPTMHAEINAIRSAAKYLGSWRLEEVDCYASLEPCHMCASALQQARIRKLYFASFEPKTGAIVSVDKFLESPHLNHQIEVRSGLLADKSTKLLKNFFKEKRNANRKLELELGGRGKRRNFKQEHFNNSLSGLE